MKQWNLGEVKVNPNGNCLYYTLTIQKLIKREQDIPKNNTYKKEVQNTKHNIVKQFKENQNSEIHFTGPSITQSNISEHKEQVLQKLNLLANSTSQ